MAIQQLLWLWIKTAQKSILEIWLKLSIARGRYGQTSKVRGKFVKANHFGVYLTFDQPHTDPNGRYGSCTYEAGQKVMFAISHAKGVFYHKHNDFEHGHETYMKLVAGFR